MKTLFITPGEPAGIGPDITIKLAQQSWPAEMVVVADPNLLLARAKLLGISLKLIDYHANKQAASKSGVLPIIPCQLHDTVVPGQLNQNNAAYVVETLKIAAESCQRAHSAAIVTAPVHKGILNDAGIPFSGHTEFFAALAGVAKTVMLFVVDNMRVALATTHIPLSQVSATLTATNLEKTINILHTELIQKFGIKQPKILIAGLNPHAGEGGHLGTEEIEVIKPLLEKMNNNGYQLIGPLPADTLFTPKQLASGDAVLAMYHDQALPVVKYCGFGHAVNVTLGLPYVRTSVDHGTALDLAGTGKADGGSMQAALALAIKLIPTSPI